MFLVLDFDLAGRFPPLGAPSRPPGTEPSLGRLSLPVPPPLAQLGGGATVGRRDLPVPTSSWGQVAAG
jgi:hypothetical protein